MSAVRGEEPEGRGPVQSGGESNSQPSAFKVLTEPDRPNHRSACPNNWERKAVLNTQLNSFNQGTQIIDPEWNKEPHSHSLYEPQRCRNKKTTRRMSLVKKDWKAYTVLHCPPHNPLGAAEKWRRKRFNWSSEKYGHWERREEKEGLLVSQAKSEVINGAPELFHRPATAQPEILHVLSTGTYCHRTPPIPVSTRSGRQRAGDNHDWETTGAGKITLTELLTQV